MFIRSHPPVLTLLERLLCFPLWPSLTARQFNANWTNRDASSTILMLSVHRLLVPYCVATSNKTPRVLCCVMLLPAEYVKRTGKLCHLIDMGNKNEDPRGRKVTSKCGFWLQVAPLTSKFTMLSNGWLKISSNEFVLLAKAHISQPVLLRVNSGGRRIGNMSSFWQNSAN
jgi:hypothetical protein